MSTVVVTVPLFTLAVAWLEDACSALEEAAEDEDELSLPVDALEQEQSATASTALTAQAAAQRPTFAPAFNFSSLYMHTSFLRDG
jgi:hypothetical protein